MKIIVLDGYTLNPGDLDWEGLKALGDVTVYDRTPADQIVSRSDGAQILLTNKTPLGEKEFAQLSSLKYVGVLATGYNVVDIDAAKKRNIMVTNIPAYGTKSVAQMAFALLLEITNHVKHHSDAVRSGAWRESKDFCFWDYPLFELAEKTMGIIGFGQIGQQVCDIASAFGMHVLAFSNRQSDQSARRNFKWAAFDELLEKSDVISLHCPLFPETRGLINKNTISKMKPSAILINTSRGPLIVEEDLAQALNEGRIRGAGLDVLSAEPPPRDNSLLSAKNCVITPHIAWATKEARARLMDIAAENVKAYQNGLPQNVVNK